jgi:hypothetical protein
MGLKKPAAADVAEEEVATEEAKVETEAEEVTTAEVVTEAKEVPAKPASDNPVQVSASQAMASTETPGKFESEMADKGFGGLEVGFYSFTTVKLATEGRFEDADGNDLGKSLIVQLMESKRKFAYNNSEDENVAEFSYDRVHNTKGDLLAPILKEWEDEGGKVSEKKYLDVTCQVVSGDLEGEVVVLSVSPSGVAKFTGYIGKLNYGNKDLNETVTEVYVGKKITTVPKPFYPWAFREYVAK